MRLFLLLIFGGCLVWGAGCRQDTSSQGIVEDDPGISYAVTLWTEKTELFFEYPVLIAGIASGPWAIHITELDGFRPITEGSLTLIFSSQDGAVQQIHTEAPTRPGIYTPAPSLAEAGVYHLTMVIEGPQVQDRIEVGKIQVYESMSAVDVEDDIGGGISFLKEQQWPIDFSVVAVERRDLQTAIQVHGDLLPVPGKIAKVAAPIDGLVLAGSNVSAPVAGERVEAGQILAVLSPAGGDDSFAETRALVQRLKREVERASRLYDAEAIPEKRLVEASAQLAVAQSRLDAMGGAGDDDHYSVRAPISGIVAERKLSNGSRVEAGDHLFTIIDASEVWVRLRVPSRYAEQVSGATGAMFTVEGSDRKYRSDQIQSIGNIIDPDSRTLPVNLVIKNPDSNLKIGMFVQAYLYTGGSGVGVSIPNEAIQNEDGVPVAYVQVGGETFERRVLRLGPTDGEYTIVTEGVEEQEHVVTVGAYQVYLGSLSTSDIATEGHAH